MILFQKIAEKRIIEAQKEGLFDDLPGAGKPIKLEDDSRIAEDLRLAYKILKNANCLPPELELRKEIARTEELLGHMKDTKEKYRQLKRLNFMIMKLNMMGRPCPLLEKPQRYEKKLLERFRR
nr:DUF1992 domain-containing protein [Desulfobacterales bacterium]